MSRKAPRSRGEAIDAQLRAMFEALEKRPVPGRLRWAADPFGDVEAPKAQARSGH
jgi:hypothetical protein